MTTVASRAHAWRRHALFMVWMTLCCAGVAGSVPQSLELATSLRGTVLDPAGKPVAGARVDVRNSMAASKFWWAHPKAPRSATTDRNGKFELRLPRSIGEVMLQTRRVGFLRARSTSLVLDVPIRNVAPMQLAPGLTLSGRVLDGQRRAVGGALVTAAVLSDELLDARGMRHRVQARSQRDGSFVLRGLDVAEYEVRAVLGSAAQEIRHLVRVEPKSRLLDLTLQSGEFLTGVVTDAAGRAVPGAYAAASGARDLGDVDKVARTDARGRFRLGPFAKPPQMLDVGLAGYSPESIPTPKGDISIVLERVAVLRGRVVDAATQLPIQQFKVGFYSCAQPGFIRVPYGDVGEVTSPKGRFEWLAMPAASWCLAVRAPGYQQLTLTDVEFVPAAVREVTFALQRGRTLRGRVIDQASRKALEGAEIGSDTYERIQEPSVRSDTAGAFTLEGLPPGDTAVSAYFDGYLSLNRQLVKAGQSFIEIELRKGAQIDGQLFAADGVTPTSGVVDMDGSKMFADEQGRFAFHNLEPGHYEIVGLGRTARTPSKQVELSEGQTVTVKLVLDAGATIRGTVAGLSPQELERMLILAHPAEALEAAPSWEPLDMPGVSGRVQVEKDGTYQMPGLAPGPTILSAGTGSERYVRRRVEVPERGELVVDFNLAQDIQVTGRVTRDGQPVEGRLVRALPLDGQQIAATVVTSFQGEYELGGLARGYYNVAPEGATPVRLLIGNPVVQDFTLPALAIAGRVVDAATSAPLPEVELQLLTDAGEAPAAGYVRTDRRGEFLLDGLNAATHVLSAYRPGYDAVSQRVELSASVQDLSIAMSRAEGVALRVLNDRGLSPSFGVRLTPLPGRQVFAPLFLMLDDAGVGRVPPALTGNTLVFSVNGYESVTVPAWQGKPLDIMLRERVQR